MQHHSSIRNVKRGYNLAKTINAALRDRAEPHGKSLFGSKVWVEKDGFKAQSRSSIKAAHEKISVITGQTTLNPRSLVKLIDEASNDLCQTADLAECLRVVHPSTTIQSDADSAVTEIQEFIQTLNTNYDLYTKMKHAVENSSSLNDDEICTLKLLIADLENSGIHLCQQTRGKFVDLMGKNLALCNMFMHHVHTPSEENNSWSEFYKADSTKEKILLDLCKTRLDLSNLVGFRSFAERSLTSTLAMTPEWVSEFLNNRLEQLLPLAEVELAQLGLEHGESLPAYELLRKQQDFVLNSCPREYHLAFENCLSMGSVLAGFSEWLGKHFGLTVDIDASPEDSWAPGVMKLTCYETKTQEELGQIYLDCLRRPGKPRQNCHFTVQVGYDKQPSTIVLLTNLGSLNGHVPFSDISDFFHEFGHGLHTLFGRTLFQHTSGTRGPTDLVEIPSTLMEIVASSDVGFLQQLAKYGETGPLPEQVATKLIDSSRCFQAVEAIHQIFLSKADQILHSSAPPLQVPFSSWVPKLWRQVQPWSILPSETANPLLRFGHLASYGGRYYSYQVSRAIAEKLYRQDFQNDSVDGKGANLIENFLRHGGGGLFPRKIVENCFVSQKHRSFELILASKS